MGVKTITRKEIKEVYTPIGKEIYCDMCNKLLGRGIYDGRREEMFDYYRVTTGHHDWGNDSCDSITEYIVCPTCLYKMFNDYISRSKGGDNSEYIDIEHDRSYLTEEE